MCEIFGFTSKKEETINNYLIEFFSHCDYHPHGWGIANIKNNQTLIKKEPTKAIESKYLVNYVAKPIKTQNVLAHIRYATMGCTNNKNCHPFTKKDNNNRTWTLIHNGTVFCCKKLDKYMKKQDGETDSERILMHIIKEINEREQEKPLKQEEQFQIINQVITTITKNNKINLILHNGEVMYVHTNLKNSLHCQKNENHIIFSTLPLNNDKWNHVPLNTLLAFKNGELIQKGEKHNNEYISSQQDAEILANLSENFRTNIFSTN